MTSVESEKQTSKSKSCKIDVKTLDDRYRWFRVFLLDSETYQLTDYVFRGMTAHEIRTSNNKENLFERESYVLRRCVVNQVDWDTALAGMASTLLGLIYHYSGTDDAAITVKKAVEWVQTDAGMLEALALVTIPGLDMYKLKTCDPSDYAKYLIVGKEMFEILYQGRVQEPQSGGQLVDTWGPGRTSVSQNLPTKPGEIGTVSEGFAWSKGR